MQVTNPAHAKMTEANTVATPLAQFFPTGLFSRWLRFPPGLTFLPHPRYIPPAAGFRGPREESSCAKSRQLKLQSDL